MQESFYEYCQRTENHALLSQWDSGRNEPLTPRQVPARSHRRAWWRCSHGHIWQAIIKSRVDGCGCPMCANRKVASGENDLAACRPDLAKQWHPSKNGILTPETVVAGSHRKVWWRCEKGHEWQARVASRTVDGAGCPVCAGKIVVPGENDLASHFPDIAAQWDTEKNGSLTAQKVSFYSNRRVWWRCERGHSYQAAVSGRTMRGSGCPYCAGRRVLPGFNDLATVQPEIAAQWEPTLNGALTPQQVTAGSRKKVWWRCSSGHVWKAAIYSRAGAQRCGCPVCAGMASRTTRRNLRPAREYAAAAALQIESSNVRRRV